MIEGPHLSRWCYDVVPNADVCCPCRRIAHCRAEAERYHRRFPLLGFDGADGVHYTIRLHKRRRRCKVCGHRHGPNKNNRAIPCKRCGCTRMLDLPVPVEATMFGMRPERYRKAPR